MNTDKDHPTTNRQAETDNTIDELVRKSKELREQSNATCEKLEELQADTKQILDEAKSSEDIDSKRSRDNQ